MLESGPFRIDGKGGIKHIDGGWEEYATIVFGRYQICRLLLTFTFFFQPVDQPVGTGLSFSSTNDFLHELNDVCFRSTVFSGPV